MTDVPTKVSVPVASAAASTINWTQIAILASGVAAYFGLNVPPETLATAMLGLMALGNLVTVFLKTWGKPTVTPGQALAALKHE